MKNTKLLLFAAIGVTGCASTPPAGPEPAQPAVFAEVREGKWEIRDTRLFVRDVGPEESPVQFQDYRADGPAKLNLLSGRHLFPQALPPISLRKALFSKSTSIP